MKRSFLALGMALGISGSVFATGWFAGQEEPPARYTPGVVAREGECVQFGYATYVRGDSNGAPDPVSAVGDLASIDASPGIEAATRELATLVPTTLSVGDIVLDQFEEGSKVASYRAAEMDGGWVVTEYEYSGPCSLDH